MQKRIAALLLSLCLLFAQLPASVGAADMGASGEVGVRTEDEGKYSATVAWTLYVNGLLVISGTGAMDEQSVPWAQYCGKITKVTLKEGITAVGSAAFAGCTAVTELTLPVTLTEISAGAFSGFENLESVLYCGTRTQWEAVAVGEQNGPLDAAAVTFPLIKGWSEENGSWYYYENGLPVKNQWKKDSRGWVWLGADGAMVTDQWVADSKGLCYVGADGYCVTSSWMEHEQGWVYLDSEGSMTKNTWKKRDGKWCYLGAEGFALTQCWQQDSYGWLWLDSDGFAVTAQWVRIEGSFYYCNAEGYRVTGTQTVDGITCHFDENGVLLDVYTVEFRDWDGTVLDSQSYKYADAVALPADPTREADGSFTYTFAGWTPEVTAVTADAVYTATYTATQIPEAEENAIIRQPQSVTADSGQSVEFSVGVQGEVVSYKWEYRKVFKWFTTSMEGYSTDTLTVPAVGYRNGYDYRCLVTFADGTEVYSEPAELTVKTVITDVKSPNDQTVVLGYKGQFSAEAKGESVKYRWYYQRPNSELWMETSMEGCTGATVMIETTTARDGYQYRCKITDITGLEVYTEPATMRVLSFVSHPETKFTPVGETVQFTVQTSVSDGFTYQWQYRRNETGAWNNTTMDGYNTATLNVAATLARNGYQYRCVITGSKNSKLESKAATLYVGDPVVITKQPEAVSAAVGEQAVFTVEATNVYDYQWQYRRNETGSWFNTSADGNTTAQVTVPVTAGKNGYQYRCQLYGYDGIDYFTNEVTLTCP